MPHRLEEIAFSLARQGAQATPTPADLDPPAAAPSVARIVEWDDKKRYGFLQFGKDRVFLHIRDFAERRKRPAVGDRVRFTIGADERGRPCARDAVHLDDGGRITLPALLLLACLLVLPGVAPELDPPPQGVASLPALKRPDTNQTSALRIHALRDGRRGE